MTTPPKLQLYRKIRRSLTGTARPEAEAPEVAQPPADPPRVTVHRRKVKATPEAPAPSGAQAGPAPSHADDQLFAPTRDDDGLGDLSLVDKEDNKAASAPVTDKVDGNDMDSAIAAVRAEGLTSRQLRIAARLAVHHGIRAGSDEEAVVCLRAQGIDPLHRGALSELLSAESRHIRGDKGGASGENSRDVAVLGKIEPVRRAVPKVADIIAGAPATPPGGAQGGAYTEEQRAREIMRVQRDIARRRRRRGFFMFLRLTFFVLLPTLLAGIYYYRVATPLYATTAEFVIQKADGSFAGSPLGGMLAGAGLAANVDSITVQSYLESREAMLRLEKEVGFSSYFSGDDVDFMLRLPKDASIEDAYRLYQKNVLISFDPSEGIIRMEVIAPDPKLSQEQSVALISYAEEQVDRLSARLRADQMSGAEKAYDAAEQAVKDAQAQVLQLQEQLGVLDPRAESGSVMARVTKLEGEIQQKELELTQLTSNPRPNQARVNGVRGDLLRLRDALRETRALLTDKQQSDGSLARTTGELALAEAELLTRQTLLSAAAEQVESARTTANKQVRYLSIGVSPVPPDEATYPKAFENTLISFLIFSGIYLMLSLTVSILREQVSA